MRVGQQVVETQLCRQFVRVLEMIYEAVCVKAAEVLGLWKVNPF